MCACLAITYLAMPLGKVKVCGVFCHCIYAKICIFGLYFSGCAEGTLEQEITIPHEIPFFCKPQN